MSRPEHWAARGQAWQLRHIHVPIQESAMAEERRKGAPDRRRSREAKQAPGNDPQQTESPNDSSALEAAEQLEESIRARQQEDRGEVF